MRHIGVAATHTRRRKRNATFIGRAFYFYGALFSQGLRNALSTACKMHPISFEEFLLSKTPQEKRLFPAGEEYVLEHSESFLSRPNGKGRNFCCPRQILQSARLSCNQKSYCLAEEVNCRREQRERVPRPPLRGALGGWKSVPASGLVGLIFVWLSERLRPRGDAPASLNKGT